MRCLTVFALFMWLLIVFSSSDYWLGRKSAAGSLSSHKCQGLPKQVNYINKLSDAGYTFQGDNKQIMLTHPNDGHLAAHKFL